MDDDLDEVFDEDVVESEAAPRARSAAARGRSVPARARSGRTAQTRASDRGFAPFGRIARFVREVFAELQKVIWPTRKELITYATVVVVFVAIMMTIVALLDAGFYQVMGWVFGGKPSQAGQ
jgi:preprotein translocase subunit SecE